MLRHSDPPLLGDLGETLRWLRSQQYPGTTAADRPGERRLQHIADAGAALGVTLHRGELRTHTEHGEPLGAAIVRLAQACLRVADLRRSPRSRPPPFADEVEAHLHAALTARPLVITRGDRIAGISATTWSVDFRVRTPERHVLLFLLSSERRDHSRKLAEHVVAACTDLAHLRKLRRTPVQFITVFDDRGAPWNDADARLVAPFATPYRWSERAAWIPALEAPEPEFDDDYADPDDPDDPPPPTSADDALRPNDDLSNDELDPADDEPRQSDDTSNDDDLDPNDGQNLGQPDRTPNERRRPDDISSDDEHAPDDLDPDDERGLTDEDDRRQLDDISHDDEHAPTDADLRQPDDDEHDPTADDRRQPDDVSNDTPADTHHDPVTPTDAHRHDDDLPTADAHLADGRAAPPPRPPSDNQRDDAPPPPPHDWPDDDAPPPEPDADDWFEHHLPELATSEPPPAPRIPPRVALESPPMSAPTSTAHSPFKNMRQATADDFPAFAALFRQLGTGDPVPPVSTWLTEQLPTTLIFERSGEVVAYVYYEVMAEFGYVRNVVVAAEHRGRGLGGEVMRALADHLRAQGCTRWCLNVEAANVAALKLYRSVGLDLAYRSMALRFPWDLVDTLLEPDEAVSTCPIHPTEDADIEASFELPPGQLATLRAKSSRILLRLNSPTIPSALDLGFAVFNPQFPGAYPFRVARPELARPLLQGLRPHALPDTFMQLVIEDDEPLYNVLMAAGATLRLTLMFLRGDLTPPQPT